MINKGVAIEYGDIAPEAKENFTPSVSEKEDFVNLEELQQDELTFKNFINPCELNLMMLDGSGLPFPDSVEDENMGLWSVQVSGEDGVFLTPIVLILTANAQYSSQGLTLTFDTYNNIFANDINIKWYRNGEVISDMNFVPDSPKYFCRNQVNNYDQVVITFYGMNMPYNRLKLRVIDYGYKTIFYGDELRSVKLIQEIDAISSEIAINVADFTLDSKTDINYSFQIKQPLKIFFNDELKATTFVSSSKRKSKKIWDVNTEDYIGLMDDIPYYGGIYTDAKAVDVLSDIFAVAKVPYEIDDIFADETITGYIPYTTCREALMQVVFAIQAVVDTSNSSVVKIFALDDDIKQSLPSSRIMQGQSFSENDKITGLKITSHLYTPIDEELEVYKAENNGIGENVFITFSEPLHDLSITNGEIIESGTNYAIINADEGCILIGLKYSHTTTEKQYNNPVILASQVEKISEIKDVTLVNQNNVDKLLERCYNYIINTESINCKIVEGKHVSYGTTIKYGQKKYGTFVYGEKTRATVEYDKVVNIGDIVELATEYLGDLKGRVMKQTFNLVGGITIKSTELKRLGDS